MSVPEVFKKIFIWVFRPIAVIFLVFSLLMLLKSEPFYFAVVIVAGVYVGHGLIEAKVSELTRKEKFIVELDDDLDEVVGHVDWLRTETLSDMDSLKDNILEEIEDPDEVCLLFEEKVEIVKKEVGEIMRKTKNIKNKIENIREDEIF